MKTSTRFQSALAVLALVQSAALWAGAAGFDTVMGNAVNMSGQRVPELVVTLDPGRRTLDRASVQGTLASLLGRAGVRPHEVELQSVATAVLQFANDQDRGVYTACFESWCARVALRGG